MKKAKAFLQKIFYPPLWVTAIVAPVTFAILIFLFATNITKGAIAYGIYCLSAYSLVVCVLYIPKLLKRLKHIKSRFLINSKILKKITATKLGYNLIYNKEFKGRVSIYQGMIVNFLYMIFRIITGIQYASVWFISIAIYYMVLGILKTYLIAGYHIGRQKSTKPIMYEYKVYGNIGKMLFLLNIPMGGMILLMIIQNASYSYPGYVIYLSAMYTFYMLIISIVNLTKFHHSGSPVLSASKVLNFVSAIMSVLALQTAMISRFSTNGLQYTKLMNTVTGTCIYFIVIAIAVYMIIHSKNKKEGADMNKSESKYFNTAIKMDIAFLELLEQKDFEYITVKEICKRAGVNRSTFYLHYETIADLLSESVEYINRHFLDYMKINSVNFMSKLNDCPIDELNLITPEYLTPYLSYIKEHKSIFKTSVKNASVLNLDKSYSAMVKYVFNPIMERFEIPQERRRYIMSFYINGLMAIISEWLKGDCKEPIENLILIIEECVLPDNKGKWRSQ